MQTKGKTINFKGQDIYIGIDVHLRSWKVTIMTENIVHKTFSQDPEAKVLANYLQNNFPGANYYSAYEAGFCGYSIHRELECYGIHNIIVNPADIPTTDKEKKQKEDRRDSRKIAKALKNGDIKGIYIPRQSTEELRGLIRYRKTLAREIGRHKNRIRSFLYLNGIEIPPELERISYYWPSRFTQWLKTIQMTTTYGNTVILETLDTTEYLRQKLLKVHRLLRAVGTDVEYSKKIKLLRSIPGIGLVGAVTIIAELEDIKRFKTLDKLCSFVGLIPTTNSSGDNEKTGSITDRSNNFVRNSIIESAWTAARTDPALSLSYNNLCKRMKPNKAIIRIAKKLLNRIRFVLNNEMEYVHSVV